MTSPSHPCQPSRAWAGAFELPLWIRACSRIAAHGGMISSDGAKSFRFFTDRLPGHDSLGAMPRQAARHLAEYADTWATRGVRAWEDRWWEIPAKMGNRIARIVGAPAGRVSMHENVTTAPLVALSCAAPVGSTAAVVCSAMDFPSMVICIARSNGRVRGEDCAGRRQLRCAESDARRDRRATAVVEFSHVLFRTSYIMDATR